MIVLDRLPRVKMLWGGNIGLAIILGCLTGLTGGFNMSGDNANAAAQRGGIAMLFLYSIVYSATYG
jgi:hypothetical protein